jgi:signal transduction histidine kinase
MPNILVVSSQIQQVILNLMLNSIEAMPNGGEVIINVGYGKEGVEIVLTDTGCGILDSERERIFEPFVSTKEDGTGLGLSVSYGIIQAHGGTIELLPDRDQGASFRIIIPTGESP